MKSNKGFSGKNGQFDSGEFLKKPAKLEPIKKNGKEKRSYIEDDEDDIDFKDLHKRESVLDYLDYGEEDED